MQDVFISYAHADADAVNRLADALSDAGLHIWIDRTEIASFASITRSIRNGLAESKAFLAYYSRAYPSRTACQWEITAAFLAAHDHLDGLDRVLIVNPEESESHIFPKGLRDRKYLRATSQPHELERVAAAIVAQVAKFSGPLGANTEWPVPQWYPARGVGSSHYVGRIEQMWELHSALNPSEAPLADTRPELAMAMVTGLGGMGKSLLVEEYALRFGSFYPAGVYWLRGFGNEQRKLDTGAELEGARNRQFRSIADLLRLRVAGNDPAEIEGLLREYFESARGAALWIVDDFPSGFDAQVLLSWCGPHPKARTVVTMRSQEHSSLGKSLLIGGMPEPDAYTLLTSRVQPRDPAEETSARTIVHELGYHALALDVAASALESYEVGAPFGTFKTELARDDEDSLEFAAELSGSLPNGHERSIAATLLHSISLGHEAARDVLRLASVLASAPIPESMALVIVGLAGRLDEQRARQWFRLAARDLRRFSLADRYGEDAGDTPAWLVHVLVARAARFTYRNDPRMEQLREAALNVLNSWLHQLFQHQQPAGPELEHARTLSRSGAGHAEHNLMQFVALHDELQGAYAAAVSAWRVLLEGMEPGAGKDDPLILSFKNNLAVALRKQGDAKQAAEIHRQVLQGRQQRLGPQNADTITSMDNLGVTLSDLGEYEEAGNLHRRAVELFSAVRGPEDPNTLTAMANLAGVLRRQGRFSEAIEQYSHLLQLRSRVLGPTHPATLRAMSGFGQTLLEAGEFAGGGQQLELAANLLEKTLGSQNPLTLEAQHNLALALMKTGDRDASRRLAERVVAGRRKILGERHLETLKSLEIESMLQAGANHLELQRDLQKEVVAALMQSLGPDHPETALAEGNLGCTLMELGDTKGARVPLENALRSASARLGTRHPITTVAAWNLYHLLENSEAERETVVKLVEDYLAWLLQANPSTIGDEQRKVRARFAQTSDGMYQIMKARLFGSAQT